MTGFYYTGYYNDATSERGMNEYDTTGSSAPSSRNDFRALGGSPVVGCIDAQDHIYTYEEFGSYAAAGYDENFNQKWTADTTATPAGPDSQGGVEVGNGHVVYTYASQDFTDISIVNASDGTIRAEVTGLYNPVVSEAVHAPDGNSFYIGFLDSNGYIGIKEYDYDGNKLGEAVSTVNLGNDNRTTDYQLKACRRGDQGGVVVSNVWNGNNGGSVGVGVVGFDSSRSIVGSQTNTTPQTSVNYKNSMGADRDYIYIATSLPFEAHKIPKDMSAINNINTDDNAYDGAMEVTPDYIVVGDSNNGIHKYDKSFNKLWGTTVNGSPMLGATYPPAGTDAWGPIITSISATKADSSGTVNTPALTDGTTSTQFTPTVSMLSGEASKIEQLASSKFDAVATVNSTSFADVFKATKFQKKVDVFTGDVNKVTKIVVPGNEFDDKLQPTVLMNTIFEDEHIRELTQAEKFNPTVSYLDTLIGDYTLSVDRYNVSPVLNDTTILIKQPAQKVAPVSTTPSADFLDKLTTTPISIEAEMNPINVGGSVIQAFRFTSNATVNSTDGFFYVEQPSTLFTEQVGVKTANTVIGTGVASTLFKAFGTPLAIFESSQANTSGQKIQVQREQTTVKDVATTYEDSVIVTPLTEALASDAFPKDLELNSILVPVDAEVGTTKLINTVNEDSELTFVFSTARTVTSRRESIAAETTVVHNSELISATSKVLQSDISRISTRGFGEQTSTQ